MRRKIQDEFTARNDISRQRKYQLRQHKQGNCTVCGQPKWGPFSRCKEHVLKARERQHRRRKCKRRYLMARSYLMEHALG